MQKIVGFIMILSGCCGLGLWYSSQFKKQVETLKDFCRILELFLGQIRFGRCTLQEGMFRITERVKEPYQQVFTDIYREICENHGESFGSICGRYLEEGLKRLPCRKQEKDIFIKCFAAEGFEEDTMQLRMIERTKEELEEILRETAAGNESRCRLALSLGAMSGLLLVILFL